MEFPTVTVYANSSNGPRASRLPWRVIYSRDEFGGYTFTAHPTLTFAKWAAYGNPNAVIHRVVLDHSNYFTAA